MKSTIKKLTTLSMVFILVFSLCGCSLFDSRAKVYSRYAISLLDINYKNISKDYMTLTGVSQKDAEAVYVDNMDYQAHNLMMTEPFFPSFIIWHRAFLQMPNTKLPR